MSSSKRNAAFFQSLNNFSTLFGVGPFRAEFRRRRTHAAHFLSRVVREADDAKLLAVGVELGHEMGDDFDGALVHVILARLFSLRTSGFEDLGRQRIGR